MCSVLFGLHRRLTVANVSQQVVSQCFSSDVVHHLEAIADRHGQSRLLLHEKVIGGPVISTQFHIIAHQKLTDGVSHAAPPPVLLTPAMLILLVLVVRLVLDLDTLLPLASLCSTAGHGCSVWIDMTPDLPDGTL